jgi:hypothetical protein
MSMTAKPVTKFSPDPERLAVIKECMENYDVGTAKAEWPNNIISRKAVVYGSGVIARKGTKVRQAVDPAELALCQRMAAEAARLMAGVEVGMGSESGDTFRGFFIAANVDDAVPKAITEKLIRDRFGGTIFPPATITVEPLKEAGKWWSEVKYDGSESAASYFKPWRKMIQWFGKRAEFKKTAFVRIGDRQALWQVPREKYPPGTEITGCVLPRMAIGLTAGGSLSGLFGCCVQT